MTTLLRTRTPLETLSMNTQPQRRRSKRLAAYEEEDGDFKFTRGSKRAKTQSAAPAPEAPAAAATSTKSRQKVLSDEAQTQAPPEKKKPTRRKMSFSTPKQEAEPASKAKVTTRRRSKRNSQETKAVQNAAVEQGDQDNVDLVGASTSDVSTEGAVEISTESTRIALPFSDTPIINRNKELRRKTGGGRRSSLGLRGRRASSLIDNGHSATPHEQVETSQFYKHIEAEGLSEPRRMKQLLTWCGERALGARPSHNNPDSAAILAARHIKESLLKDFSNRSDMSDWFNREDTGRSVVVKKTPNPLNVQNAAKIQELEEKIKKLKAEKAQWKSLIAHPPQLSPLIDPESSPDTETKTEPPIPKPSDIDPSLLDPEDAHILTSLLSLSSSSSSSSSTSTTTLPSSTLLSTTSTRTQSLLSGLEFQIDQFATGIHRLEQARLAMEDTATKVLSLSALRLEEREREEKRSVGTGDLPIQEVLRGLSRVLPEGRGASGR